MLRGVSYSTGSEDYKEWVTGISLGFVLPYMEMGHECYVKNSNYRGGEGYEV